MWPICQVEKLEHKDFYAWLCEDPYCAGLLSLIPVKEIGGCLIYSNEAKSVLNLFLLN